MAHQRVVFATYRAHPELENDDLVLAAACHQLGLRVDERPWDLIDPLEGGCSVVIRSTWDYHLHASRFASWLRALQSQRVEVFNHPDVCLWNLDKRYLFELRDRGVAIPRTTYIVPGQGADWTRAFDDLACERAVVKPVVGATAFGASIIHRNGPLPQAPVDAGGVLCQEFLPEVQEDGEYSLVFIGGAFSHSVLKRAAAGEFRVQREFGGTFELVDAPEHFVDFGRSVLRAAQFSTAFARIDIVGTRDRGPVLMELEMLEPNLFWSLAPQQASHLARIIAGDVLVPTDGA